MNLLAWCGLYLAAMAPAVASPYAGWENGPPSDPNYFPIGVWLQAPKNAPRYKAVGVNFYLGLWRGPTQEQLDALTDAGMPVICHQNAIGLENRDNPTIIGWMHGDEPDNAQRLPDGSGYGPPVAPAKIIEDYERWRTADPTRPVLLNLGQGVANDEWRGRGSQGKPEDYLGYVKGADIVSFDIYPVANDYPNVHGNLWHVPKGVDRLREWTNDERIVWNVVETTRISNLDAKVTPYQLRAEVWMSLIAGSTGIVYFCHQFEPTFIEAGFLADEEMTEAITRVNRQIRALAPVLNSPSVNDIVAVESSNADVPVRVMAKRHAGSVYLFAVAMRDRATTATFRVDDLPEAATVEALGEDRRVPVENGRFQRAFDGYAVHLYRVSY